MSNMYSTERYRKARKRAEEMLSQMTLTEKIGQLSQFGTSIYSDNEKTYEDHFAEARLVRILPSRVRKRPTVFNVLC